MPSRLTSSCVGARPTTLLFLVGCRIDPPVSSAIAQVTRFAATDVPDPLLDVPGRPLGVVRIAAHAAEWAARDARSDVRLREDDGARIAQALDERGVPRRTIVGVRDVGAGRRAHVERVVPVLDGEHDAVQRADQLAGGLEIGVLLRRDLERVRHVGVVVGAIGHAPRLARVEAQRLAGGGPQVHGDQRS